MKLGQMPFWGEASEEDRYVIWSFYVEAGGQVTDYSRFCDLMEGEDA